MRHFWWPSKALRRPSRLFPSVYSIITSDMTHAIAAIQKAWWRTPSRFAPRRKHDSARDLDDGHGRRRPKSPWVLICLTSTAIEPMDPDDHCANSREGMNRSSYFLPFEGTPASLAPG